MMQVQATVLGNDWVNRRYKHMSVYAPQVAGLCQAGQFFHIRCSDDVTPLLRRPMSIYRYEPERGEVHFLYHVKGQGTQWLAARKPGDAVDLFGPLGRGFCIRPGWRRILVLARGVGLATLAPVARMAQEQGIGTIAVLSARTAEDVLSKDEMERFGARVMVVLDEDGTSEVAAVERLVREVVEREHVDALFTCGSRRLTRLLQRVARDTGLPGQVALEENMGCGLGMCFCCVRPFWRGGERVNLRVCADGPVFDLSEVLEA